MIIDVSNKTNKKKKIVRSTAPPPITHCTQLHWAAEGAK